VRTGALVSCSGMTFQAQGFPAQAFLIQAHTLLVCLVFRLRVFSSRWRDHLVEVSIWW